MEFLTSNGPIGDEQVDTAFPHGTIRLVDDVAGTFIEGNVEEALGDTSRRP